MAAKAMSIGINGSMLDEQPTGVGIYSFNLINQLAVLYKDELLRPITVFTPTKLLLNKNLKTIRLSKLLLSSRFGKIAAFCRFFWNTFYYPLQARRFDLLISPTTHGSFILKNQIITIHDLISLRYDNISAHQRFYFNYFLPFLVRKARMITTVSESSKQDIIDFLECPAEKIMVVHNGYDQATYYPLPEKTGDILKAYGFENYLLAVGATYPHKNLARLIQAYGQLDEKLRTSNPLVIAGGRLKYLSQLRSLVSELKLEKTVHFTGYVAAELMPSLYREAVALVFPSLYEGFGIPLLEAMACGCPVIASNASSMKEVCGEAALYFDPVDTGAITNSIRKIINEPDVAAGLKEKGFAQVQKFSWLQTATAFKKIIEKNFSSAKN